MKISLLPQKLHRQRNAIDTVHTQTIYNTYILRKKVLEEKMSLNTKRHRGQNVLEEKMSWRTKHRRNKNVLNTKRLRGIS